MRQPARLHKQEQDNFSPFLNKLCNEIEDWAYAHAPQLMVILIVLMIVLFVLVCYAICGISATESGVTYNQFERII